MVNVLHSCTNARSKTLDSKVSWGTGDGILQNLGPKIFREIS